MPDFKESTLQSFLQSSETYSKVIDECLVQKISSRANLIDDKPSFSESKEIHNLLESVRTSRDKIQQMATKTHTESKILSIQMRKQFLQVETLNSQEILSLLWLIVRLKQQCESKCLEDYLDLKYNISLLNRLEVVNKSDQKLMCKSELFERQLEHKLKLLCNSFNANDYSKLFQQFQIIKSADSILDLQHSIFLELIQESTEQCLFSFMNSGSQNYIEAAKRIETESQFINAVQLLVDCLQKVFSNHILIHNHLRANSVSHLDLTEYRKSISFAAQSRLQTFLGSHQISHFTNLSEIVGLSQKFSLKCEKFSPESSSSIEYYLSQVVLLFINNFHTRCMKSLQRFLNMESWKSFDAQMKFSGTTKMIPAVTAHVLEICDAYYSLKNEFSLCVKEIFACTQKFLQTFVKVSNFRFFLFSCPILKIAMMNWKQYFELKSQTSSHNTFPSPRLLKYFLNTHERRK